MGMGVESLPLLSDVGIHERLPIAVESPTAQLQECLGAGNRPMHAGTLQTSLDHMSASAFDHAGGDGITRRQVLIVVQPRLVMMKILTNLIQSFPLRPG